MQVTQKEEQSGGAAASDILFTLHRQRNKIACFFSIGVICALIYILTAAPNYQSDAKLLVRYVVDKSAIDQVESQFGRDASELSGSIVNSEIEILKSWDLAAKVVENLSVDRFRGESRGIETEVDAVRYILSKLVVTQQRDSHVISVGFRARDPVLARLVLEDLVNLYLAKHLEVHRSAGVLQFVAEETAEAENRLAQLERQSQSEKANYGVFSIPETAVNLDGQISKNQDSIFAADVEWAEQATKVQELKNTASDRSLSERLTSSTASKLGVDDEVQRYRSLTIRLGELMRVEWDLLARYTPENKSVQLQRALITEVKEEMTALERLHPLLADAANLNGSNRGQNTMSLFMESAKLAGIESKRKALQTQAAQLRAKANSLSELAPKILQLERHKELEAANLKYFSTSLERVKIDQMLDPSKIPNISVVQKPSPAVVATGEFKKFVIGLIFGGLGVGFATALVIDMLIDKSVKRPIECKTRVNLPLMLTIPFYSNGSCGLLHRTLYSLAGSLRPKDSRVPAVPFDVVRLMGSYCISIRDRIAFSFQKNRVMHQPKLLGISGCSHGVGTSTLASGLASAFSENGGCNVLLVDLNSASNNSANGEAGSSKVYTLAETLESGVTEHQPRGNVILATGNSGDIGAKLTPKYFHELLPKLKASEFDYIIFDMPPMVQTSATVALAGAMDKMLLVVAAEHTHRSDAKRAFEDLAGVNDGVAVILNKCRFAFPTWFDE